MEKGALQPERVVLRKLLREVRKEAGLRQVGLAERLGRPQSFVSDVEKGQRRVDVLELREICVACEIPLAVFIARLEAWLERGGA
ncbi:helix-turn-helix domain-containing protein [Longimicrobium terrae]|uniref:Transcriptional regulator with XRE-family HTH domain n=1 Tax=Longimicrobium terrae TaxID=1639882 RepID=A0A841H1M9_9BACT|nr:helix-turn-helix transcriptional regulator [Longimicrobium terrae]MBB4637495.1 transcriptional regulator with XRE-family HTH domain [Longimicrobium terrae]MBB6071892.1 transcriptional regulator with XRE-family HTH domain [Longimicrobium terrae]NNC30442.1 helix-turn-helix transcriptional regulator [Longimicrobium terrae]